MNMKKLTTCCGVPGNSLRSSGSWVATPTGQVLRWHLRIMMQPCEISAAVPNPTSSAPSSAAITTSRPVRMPPSVWTAIRPRSSLATSVWWVSARPISQCEPACMIDVNGLAPVPPSYPEMSTWSARALATPAAMVPTPTSDTSLTLIRASGLTFLRS